MSGFFRFSLRIPRELHARVTTFLAQRPEPGSLNDLFVRYILEGLERDEVQERIPVQLLREVGVEEEKITEALDALRKR